MFERKQKSIELFGKNFILYERNAVDALSFAQFSVKNNSEDMQTYLYKALQIIVASLKMNYDNLPWYKYIEKRKLKRLLSYKHLIHHLSQQQIFEIAKDILDLEGLVPVDDEKKTSVKV